jgi:UDP-N-acetyl-D-mannosaminuronic acid transferase (WecB/TagA/CpsF family)
MSLLSSLLDLRASKQDSQDPVLEAVDMSPDDYEHLVDLLTEYHDKMVRLMGEVQGSLDLIPRHYKQQANILIALGGEHGYMASKSESSMAKMIEELKEEGEAMDAFDKSGGVDQDDME